VQASSATAITAAPITYISALLSRTLQSRENSKVHIFQDSNGALSKAFLRFRNVVNTIPN